MSRYSILYSGGSGTVSIRNPNYKNGEEKLSKPKLWQSLSGQFAQYALTLQRKQKFILSVGDDGAILTYIRNGEVEHCLKAALSSEEEKQTLQDFLTLHSSVPVYILIDVIDQNYTLHTLPGVSVLEIQSLVKRRLAKDFSATDIKNSLSFGRSSSKRKDWQYLFIGAPFISPLSDWVNLVMEAPNHIEGLYMLPLETKILATRLNAAIFPKDGEKKQSEHQIFLTHNKVCGFRQTVFKNNQLLFTRVVDTDMGSTVDLAVNTIEQELRNALEYLRRLAYKESDGLDVFIIVSEEIKQHLLSIRLEGRNVIILTPFEAAELLHLHNTVTPNAKFADILIAANFAKAKPTLLFHNQKTKKFSSLRMLHQYTLILTILLAPVSGFAIVKKIMTLSTISQEIETLSRKDINIEHSWANAQKDNYSIDESYKIIDIVTLHKLLTDDFASPLNTLKLFHEIQDNDVAVRMLEWSNKEQEKQERSSRKKTTYRVLQTTLDVELYNNTNSLAGIIDKFDLFTKKIQDKFSDYDVTYSNLPEKLTFDMENIPLPIKVSLSESRKISKNRR